MALTFSRYTPNQWISRTFASTETTTWITSTFPQATSMTQSFSITVYGGVQPSANAVIDNWVANNYNSTFLIHFSPHAFYLAQPTTVKSDANAWIELYASLGSNVANNTGTATWAIMWANTAPYSAITGASVANTRFMVVPVSDLAGNGVVRLYDTALVTGNPYSLNDLSFTVQVSPY